MTKDYIWWKDASVYQIWPASYKDSNGDGVGDIPGIISTLNYVKSLGTDVIWLSPMYDSPQDDMGYDISNYEKVYPKYGTLEDMDNLIEGTHKRGMKLILDLVINHTSTEHDWFKQSRSSKTDPKRDWYIWKPARYDAEGNRHPPNNWVSHFSGSAWAYDETTDEYYLHLFAESQPDLNWENEETRKAIYKSALSFWFEKGIDGFRIDTAGMYSKVQSFSDAPIVFPDSEWQPCQKYFQNGPRIHEFHKEMFASVTSKYDAMTVGEVGHSPREDSLKYVSAKEKEMNMMFLFDAVEVGSNPSDRFIYDGYKLTDFKKAVQNQSSFIEGTDAWSTVFYENHDQPRSITRFGNDSNKYRVKSGKLLALLQSTLSGTLYIYQGQEIGMTNLPRSWSIDEYLDINTINYYKEFKAKYGDNKEKMDKLMDNINLLARDHARSPVQWDDTENAGFSTGKPWMRVNDNYKEINVASQVNDPNSLFSFWKQSLKIRKEYKDLLIYGSFKILDNENQKIFTYVKEAAGQKAYIVLNFTSESLKFENLDGGKLELLHSNVNVEDEGTLSPYEGRFYLIK
ncbi:DEHA2A13882p [Debaryomyces hansenii CBS767]|jgi:alpha-glucosidase|uniref:Alpha-glucosidase n=1 Tax=Debaryomyces hansenii (strain ATCC 36239 / CBS 767 / BCRC 21394 / JCM 1990 / NBRC 0083 / IGC 2968) TaxID=284592 RepID=Q6BXY6_DEBHA|nr:DEHA2A13882p [Debaryomyces hansenii CBS767]CAG84911.1 DEHA2A13882p [Debaryomyces hansenii CBS767]|eukprot:XP_456933.1 DEHA2A13882p [Debaryomyces hansenii CBS767]